LSANNVSVAGRFRARREDGKLEYRLKKPLHGGAMTPVQTAPSGLPAYFKRPALGGVLFAGGYGDNSAEMFDGKSWTMVAPMATQRAYFPMAVLADQRVLACGGFVELSCDDWGCTEVLTNRCEIWR